MSNFNNNKALIISIATAIFTGIFIILFLTGKIIDIPNGTHKGGIISALGVGIVLMTITIITFLVNSIHKRKQKSKS